MTEAWDSESNQEMLGIAIDTFLNPNEGERYSFDNYGLTHYVGIAGLGEDGPTLPVNHKRAGAFGYNRPTSIRDIQDGTSNTIMLAESSDHGAWGAAGRPTLRSLTAQPYINGPDGIGTTNGRLGNVSVGFADGSVRTISENIDPTVMEALSTINGGEVVNDF